MHFVCTSQDLVAKALVSSTDYNKLPIKYRWIVGKEGGENPEVKGKNKL